MNFKICRQLIHEDFRKVLTQQPHGKISEYLYILRYLISVTILFSALTRMFPKPTFAP